MEHRFEISRKKWLRRPKKKSKHYSFSSYLLRPSDKRMCCVGFYLVSVGVAMENLLGHSIAGEIPSYCIPEVARWLISDTNNFSSSAVANKLYDANDISGNESVIKNLFASQNIKVTFID